MIFRFGLIALLFFIPMAKGIGAEIIPGTPYEMALPTGFETRGGGLILNPKTGARVRINRFPISVDDQKKQFSPEVLKKRDMVLISEKAFESDTLKGQLLELNAPGLKQLALLLSHPTGSVLILSSTPEALEGEHAAIREAFQTLKLSEEGWFDPFAGFPFSFKDPEGKKFVRRQGSVVVYSKSGQSPDPEGEILLIAKEPVQSGNKEDVFMTRIESLGINLSPEGAIKELTLDGQKALWGVFFNDGLKPKQLVRGMVWGTGYQVTFSGFCPKENKACVSQLEASFKSFSGVQ